jgi:hypothetical protein
MSIIISSGNCVVVLLITQKYRVPLGERVETNLSMVVVMECCAGSLTVGRKAKEMNKMRVGR